MANKVWFVTGSSRGFGRLWVEAALERGDFVAATARDASALADLTARYGDAVLPLALDVTDERQVSEAVRAAHERFGRLDVVVNNAGNSLIATIEEATDADARKIFETNLFGALHVVRAALPILRAQGNGRIIAVSSGLAIAPLPLIGYYCATKAALESLHESLAAEVRPFGIDVVILEPGRYATDFGASATRIEGMREYDAFREGVVARMMQAPSGDPKATPPAVLHVADMENPPLRFALGDTILPRAEAAYGERLASWRAWSHVSNPAQGSAAVH